MKEWFRRDGGEARRTGRFFFKDESRSRNKPYSEKNSGTGVKDLHRRGKFLAHTSAARSLIRYLKADGTVHESPHGIEEYPTCRFVFGNDGPPQMAICKSDVQRVSLTINHAAMAVSANRGLVLLMICAGDRLPASHPTHPIACKASPILRALTEGTRYP